MIVMLIKYCGIRYNGATYKIKLVLKDNALIVYFQWTCNKLHRTSVNANVHRTYDI